MKFTESMPYALTAFQLEFMVRLMTNGYKVCIMPGNPSELMQGPTVALRREFGESYVYMYMLRDGSVCDAGGFRRFHDFCQFRDIEVIDE